MSSSIYLDYNATTPAAPGVVEEMLPWFVDRFWNASSSHPSGRVAAAAVEAGRERVAGLIGARSAEVVWTSGATEATNLALKGLPPTGERRRVVTIATEHKATLDTVAALEHGGTPVTVVPVETDGSLSLDRLHSELDGSVLVVSVMAANNETGVVTDLPPVADMVHECGALLHSDITQVVGKMPFSVSDSGIDLASLSSHKIYGPKGIGALFVSRRVKLSPLIHGGGHEWGLRSGTLNVPGIVGFGTAADLATASLETEVHRQGRLVRRMLEELRGHVGDVLQTTDAPLRLANTLNIRVVGADAEAVMANAPDVALSSGSACTALVPSPSHVLLAMGFDRTAALECLRISVGRPTMEQDVVAAAELLAAAITRVRALS